ncbi:hypothetical protein [Clostridium tertium]|uniref:hypothetical protein n=1 Tax=Clostridium tertium TaxID=1559 RepID=UPI0011595982
MAFIKPEIYAPIVTEKFKGKVRISNLADDLGLLSGSVGETVSFPMFNKIGNAKEMVKGEGIDEEELTQVENKATIKQVSAPGVVVYDIENLTALGNQLDNGASQQGTVIARKVDSDLIAECDKTTLKVATASATEVTANELNQGLMMFGDEQDTEEIGGIIINSMVSGSFYRMIEFTDAGKTYNGVNGNGIVKNGVIGYFRGIPVILSDKDTLDSTKSECKTYIIKKHALGKMFKSEKVCDVEFERQAKYKRTAIYTDSVYAVKLLDQEGVVLLRKTIA